MASSIIGGLIERQHRPPPPTGVHTQVERHAPQPRQLFFGLQGPGKGAALAELVTALCLCGEISIIGAIAAGHFSRAHAKLARQR